MKRVLSLLLAVVMLCSTFAGLQLTANAALPKSGKCGDNVNYTYNASTGAVIISGTGKMWGTVYLDDDENECSVFTNTNITSVIIQSGVTDIGDFMFKDCSKLKSIRIANTVVNIGTEALLGCNGLTSIIVDSGNAKYDSRNQCNAIIETATNTLIYGCKNTVIPNTVTNIGDEAFRGCDGLTSITIPNSVTEIDTNSFYGCELKSVTVAPENTKYDSRNQCNAIIETATNTLIYGCKNTVIPNTVTNIGDEAFRGCNGLTSITIPNSVKSIGEEAFFLCSSLKRVILTTGITNISFDAFWWSFDISDVYYSGSPAQWKKINIDEGNEALTSAKIHYYHNAKSILLFKSLARTSKAIKVGCNKVAGATGYQVQISTKDGKKWSTYKNLGEYETNYVFTNLAAGNYYKFRIRSFKKDAAGKVTFSAWSKTITTPTLPTDKVSGLKCKTRKATEQTLTWKAVKGACSYVVKISDKTGKKWEREMVVTGNSCTVKKLSAGCNYKFKVKYSLKLDTGKKVHSNWSATIASPSLPQGTSITKLTGGKKCFTAQWKKTPYTGYQIQYSTNAKFTGAKKATAKEAKKLKATISKLNAKKTYYVRIRTYKTISKVHYFSAWSKTYKVKTK